jgi:hypothetical protein
MKKVSFLYHSIQKQSFCRSVLNLFIIHSRLAIRDSDPKQLTLKIARAKAEAIRKRVVNFVFFIMKKTLSL